MHAAIARSHAGAHAFTLTGWIHVLDSGLGAGGDRVINYCDGTSGFDLVWEPDDATVVGNAPATGTGGHLKLSVNEWPDSNAHPQSGPGSVPVSVTGAWPRWHFFAVTYEADASRVQWYFGDSLNAAAVDAGAINGNYSNGAVKVRAR